jgi:hypothetical protein
LFKQSLPAIINTPGGNQKILSTMRAIAEYDVERAKIARRLQTGQISVQDADGMYSALGNPLAEWVSGAAIVAPSTAPARQPTIVDGFTIEAIE